MGVVRKPPSPNVLSSQPLAAEADHGELVVRIDQMAARTKILPFCMTRSVGSVMNVLKI
jgi:hypothetical protein